jgi:dihydropteroate synthase-like protein
VNHNLTSPSKPHYHFVTGRLAESALREVVSALAPTVGFDYSIGVMPITVAALMTPKWLMRHLSIPSSTTAVVLPGYLADARHEIEQTISCTVMFGPRDLRQLPEFFGQKSNHEDVMKDFDIRIIAEINHAPRLTTDELIERATTLRAEGADVIDVGCDPGSRWSNVGDAVARLVDLGFAISIDTFDSWEAAEACRRGASLVLSVNSSNRNAAVDWGREVVAIPDTPDDEKSFFETIEFLATKSVPHRLDPILEPIGMGFTQSLLRYAQTRRTFPQAEMMMGIGNLTELTDVDSAGINFMLLAICQELSIRSVLTTQVINWARSSVRECDLARRMVHYSVHHQTPPKRLDSSLVMLRDAKLRPYSQQSLADIASQIKDNNYRIYAQHEQIHLISAGVNLVGTDPFEIFERLQQLPQSDNVDESHAFYLGFEMAKAMTALTLGKQYEQDQALNWGHLTRAEQHHRIARKSRHKRDRS